MADREDKKTIKNMWVMGKMTKKIREIVTNHPVRRVLMWVMRTIIIKTIGNKGEQ